MISICIIPALSGSLKDKINGSITCLILDSLYIVPMLF